MLHLGIAFGTVVVQVDQEAAIVVGQVRVARYEGFDLGENGLVSAQHGVERYASVERLSRLDGVLGKGCRYRLALQTCSDVVEEIDTFTRCYLESWLHNVD